MIYTQFVCVIPITQNNGINKSLRHSERSDECNEAEVEESEVEILRRFTPQDDKMEHCFMVLV